MKMFTYILALTAAIFIFATPKDIKACNSCSCNSGYYGEYQNIYQSPYYNYTQVCPITYPSSYYGYVSDYYLNYPHNYDYGNYYTPYNNLQTYNSYETINYSQGYVNYDYTNRNWNNNYYTNFYYNY